jgi:putative membrane protein
MIDDHTAAGEKMKAAAQQDGISPPDGMVEKHQAQLQEFEAFSQNGEESALRSFAAETLPTLQEHQTEADALAQGE